MNLPVVMINSYDACPFDSVHGVRNEGTYLSARHLISLGHRRIGFAGGAVFIGWQWFRRRQCRSV